MASVINSDATNVKFLRICSDDIVMFHCGIHVLVRIADGREICLDYGGDACRQP